MDIKTLHLIGSKKMGGAERWFFRFTKALNENIGVERGIRKGSELCKIKDGIKTHFLLFKTVWDPISKIQIKRLIKKLSPHIVQTYMGRATRLTYIPKESGIIHISRIGGYYKLHSFVHAHAWIGNTKGICDYLIKNGFPKERVFLIYNFVEIPKSLWSKKELNKKRKELKITPEDFVILSLGRLIPVKGHEYLIKAFSILKERLKRPVKLILLGDGPLKNRLKDLSISLNVDKQIVFYGWSDEPEIFYELCDLVVFPSLKMETFGNVVLEAWAYEKPVVCTDFLGAQEITKDELNVLKAPCEDPFALAEKIILAIEKEDLRRFIAKNGKEEVLKKFNKEKIISEYIELYKYLLKLK